MPSTKKKRASLNSLEQVPIPEKELNNILPLLPLPINRDVDIDAYVDVDKLKSAIEIQFRKELVKNSRTILSCLVCDHTNNDSGLCKICFKNDKQTVPIYSSTYNDNMKRRNTVKSSTTMNTTTKDIKPTNKTQDQGLTLRPSSAIDLFSKNSKSKKIPSWYNLPYNKTVLSNRTSLKKDIGDLDNFLQQSFREKFRQLQVNKT